MAFANENTLWHHEQNGTMDEFHARFEDAVKEVRSKLGETHPNYISGRAVQGDGTFKSNSPQDTKVLIGRFQKGTRDDARKAIASARRYFPTWSKTAYAERARIFRRLGRLLRRDKYLLAAGMTLEAGKTRTEAIIDVDEGIDFVFYYASELVRTKGYQMSMGKPFPDETCTSQLKPYGVFAVISPFNFPVAITIGMTTAALITGNTVVLKPSSDCPFVGLMFYHLARKAGVPRSALHFVAGPGRSVGAELVESKHVKGLAFTGSRPVGIAANLTSAKVNQRPVIAEMGGKNPIIITKKADLKKAVEGVFRSAFGYSGQKCSACSRVLVDRAIAARFRKALKERIDGTKVGDPAKEDTYMGPVINEPTYRKFAKYAKLAKADGKILSGGKQIKTGKLKAGFFVEPTVVYDLPRNHPINRTELFLPFTSIIEVDGLEDAVAEANKVEYGLTAGIFSKDPKELDYFFSNIQAGTTYSNRWRGGSTAAVVNGQPFCGWKNSGISGKGAGGRYYLPQFMHEQSQTRVS